MLTEATAYRSISPAPGLSRRPGWTQARIVGVLAPQHLAGVASALQRIDLERTRSVSRWSGVMMSAVPVTWLLRNPRGRVAPEAVEGDILRVSDGITTIYLAPRESAAASTSRGSARGEQCLKPRGY